MKICIVSTSDVGHGAGISAYNLMNALISQGHDCTMMVSEKLSSDINVMKFSPSAALKQFCDKAETYLNKTRFQSIFSSILLRTNYRKIFQQYDIVNFHNIHWHSNNLSPLLFLRIHKPIVWTIHDMWPITGHCIFNYEECENYKVFCSGVCPISAGYISMKSKEIPYALKIKKYIYSLAKLHVVSPSNWLYNCIQASPAIKPLSANVVPYSVDVSTFYVKDNMHVRKKLDLQDDKFTILFSAGHLQDPRKGIKYFTKALLSLYNYRNSIKIFFVGSGTSPSSIVDCFETVEFGLVQDRISLCDIYNAADISVVPTIADNLPNVVLESMACGTPVVGFKTGGVPDIIENGVDGYIVTRKSTSELAAKIKFLHDNSEILREFSEKSAIKIAQKYSPEVQASRYIEIFKHAIANYKR